MASAAVVPPASTPARISIASSAPGIFRSASWGAMRSLAQSRPAPAASVPSAKRPQRCSPFDARPRSASVSTSR